MILKITTSTVFIVTVFTSVVSGIKTCEKEKDCQRYTECKVAADLVTFQQNEMTLNLFRNAECGFDSDSDEIMVCCSDFPEQIQSKHGGINDSEKLKLLPDDCGNTDGRRIVGGNIAAIYEFPWMALIELNISGSTEYRCSGSIISSKYVLTAAHCVKNRDVASVRVGDFNIQYPTDCQGEQDNLVCESHIQDLPIEEIIVHESYNPKDGVRAHGDIALIRTEDSIDIKKHKNVKPICLPMLEELQYLELAGEIATVSGWGLTELGKTSSVLRKVRVPIKSEQVCQATRSINENEICAGDFNKDSCDGDSGAPLVLVMKYNESYRAVQFGIVSHGPRECGSQSPGAYTDVRKYVNWILEKIRE